MTTTSSRSFSGVSVLRPIEGINAIWDGTISLNLVDPSDNAEKNIYDARATALGISTTSYALDASWQNRLFAALTSYALVADVSFSFETNNLAADYFLGGQSTMLSSGPVQGIGQVPGLGNYVLAFDTQNNQTPTATETGGGSGRDWLILHEVGHVFGLAHPFGNANGTVGDGLAFDQQPSTYQSTYTVMSYDHDIDGRDMTTTYGLAVTPMALDIAAIQNMYGAKPAYTDANVYYLTNSGSAARDLDGSDGDVTIGRAYYSIWDTGGFDTIQYNGSSKVLINLNAATLSTDTPSGDLAALLTQLASDTTFTSLNSDTKAEITNPAYTAGGFFSSVLSGSDRIAGGYTIAHGAQIEQAVGGSGNDLLIGNEDGNVLDGRNGNDHLYGGAGADQLFGGRGANVLNAGSGNDRLYDEGTGSTIDGGSGDDLIVVWGTGATIYGGPGDDLIDASGIPFKNFPWNDTHHRDGYYAVLHFTVGDGHDAIFTPPITGSSPFGNKDEGWRGIERIVFDGLSSDDVEAVWDYSNPAGFYAEGNMAFRIKSTGDTLYVGNDGAMMGGSISTDSYAYPMLLEFTDGVKETTSIENVVHASVSAYAGALNLLVRDGGGATSGTSGDDALSSSAGNDIIYAGDGNDFISAGSIYSFGGYDEFHGGEGTDTLLATADDQVIHIAAIDGVEIISSNGFSNLTITGSYEADTLDFSGTTLTEVGSIGGDSGDDVIIGSVGADVVIGGLGDDTIAGGDGDDLFLVGQDDGADSIDGGAGTDEVRATSDNVSLAFLSMASIETVSGGGFEHVHLAGSYGDDVIDLNSVTVSGIESVDGGAGNDLITGTAGGDTIAGQWGSDEIHAEAGNDLILFESPMDPWSDLDTIDGGDGIDTVGAAEDFAILSLGSLENVEILSALGHDWVELWGGESTDSWDFSAVTPGASAAIVLDGAIQLRGWGGDDTIVGSPGDDVIDGGQGADQLTGNGGADIFRYGQVTDSPAGSGSDVVADFAVGTDQIDLDWVDADSATPESESFQFIGTTAFSGTAGELRYEVSNGSAFVTGDVDGDANADFEIQLVGVSSLSQSDFLL